MQYLEPHSHLSPQQRLPPMGQAIRGGPDQAAMLMSRYRVPNFPTHRDVYPTCPPGFTPGVVMRPALPPMEKDQLYSPGLRSLSPGDAEALYSCMDPKLWADSMLNPMMLPPMVDAYYNGLDFHAPGYRKNVTKETTGPLKAWLQDHRKNPYPTKAEKIMLAIITKMTLTQVSTWFANARRRLKKETGSRLDSEDGDCKILSDDEDESEATGSKQESDNEDYEISVDDDEDDNTSTDSGRVSSSTETQALLSPASRGVSRDYFRSLSRRHDKSVACERTIASLGNSKVVSSGAMYFTDGAQRQKQSKLLCETEAKPVDLSQNGSTHDPHSPQQPPQQQQQQQQRLAIGHASTQPSHQHQSQRVAHSPQAPKNKIWSISNILSKDSADQNT